LASRKDAQIVRVTRAAAAIHPVAEAVRWRPARFFVFSPAQIIGHIPSLTFVSSRIFFLLHF
jgi:hypothetical protein